MCKDRNCGLCGEKSCADFRQNIIDGKKQSSECPFYKEGELDIINEEIKDNNEENTVHNKNLDFHNNVYDFILKPIGEELSARKIIRPFRTDVIEKLDIKVGDIVKARPMGAGCPVTHVLKVYDIDEMAGLLYTWVVGPQFSRGKDVKDIRAYAMVGFEGIAEDIINHPKVGKSAGFMPNFCMLRLTHHGLVNKVLNTSEGLVVRIEDIHIAKI